MQQLRDIRDTVRPDETLLVVDAMIGQDAVNTAALFNEQVGFDGVVLTKLDGDARGGAALSIVGVTGRPIMFASTGEKVDDFEAFHPDRMAGRILDMGDVLSAHRAGRAGVRRRSGPADGRQGRARRGLHAQRLPGADAGRQEDGLAVQAARACCPGMGDVKQQLEQLDDREIDRVSAIIQSMTPAERDDPKILNGSRRSRIARGAGVEVQQINALVDRFGEAQKMMRQMRAGKGSPPGCRGCRRCPGSAAGRRRRARRRRRRRPRRAGRATRPSGRSRSGRGGRASQLVDPASPGAARRSSRTCSAAS